MKIITKKIKLSELREMTAMMLGNLIKAVVDIKKEIMVVDAELHSDEEALLIKEGSKQQDIWGINIYPDLPADQRIEFDSMINLRPRLGNRTRGIEDPEIRYKIKLIVNRLIEE
ncbi:MAG: DUF5674 family protein [Actinobacteria bacterium]|nr:DUF5674 family protein [Actinomycetota bacterium]